MADENKLSSEDVEAVRMSAQRLRELSAKHYGEVGLEVHRITAKRAEDVADKIERRLTA